MNNNTLLSPLYSRKMVLFSEKTVKIFRINDLRKKQELINSLSEKHNHANIPNMISKSRSSSSFKELEKRDRDMKNGKFQINGWHYMTVCFTKAENSLDYYKKVIQYMIEFTNTSDLLKYNMTFQVAPVIIKHTYGNYYIILRIRVYNNLVPDVYTIVTNVNSLFNTKFKSDMYITYESESGNFQYFQWLYAKEFTLYFKNKNHSRSFGDLKDATPKAEETFQEEVRYATMSMEKEPPPPPMPKTFTLFPVTQVAPVSSLYDNSFLLSRY